MSEAVSTSQEPSTAQGRRWLVLIPLLAAGVAIVHGWRLPIPWAATQAQFTCDLIPKRCAFGQALAWVHFPVGRYDAFAALSTALLAATIVVYGVVVWRSALRRSLAGIVLAASLAGSFGVSVLAALNGYLDIPMAMLAALCIAAPARYRLWASWAAALIGVAVHEGYLVIFLPVTLLPLLLAVRRPSDLAAPLAIAASAAAIVALLALNKPLPDAALASVAGVLQKRVDFPIDTSAVVVMGRSVGGNLHMMAQLVHTSWWRGQALAGLAIILPPGAMFAWAILGGLPASPWAKIMIIAAGLSPLAMNVIGFDTWRWSALCVPTMVLAAAVACDRYAPIRPREIPLFIGIALMLAPLPLLMPRPLSQDPRLNADVTRIIGSPD